jgi:hypothetical protein
MIQNIVTTPAVTQILARLVTTLRKSARVRSVQIQNALARFLLHRRQLP